MPEQVGVGVVGVGVFGQLHARVCNELAETRLVAAWSRSDRSLEPIRDLYGVYTTTDINELVARPDLDAVIVCTPDHAHAEPVVAAAQAGKHVFVEKPMATSVADCDQMIHAARAGGVKFMVGHILRFDPRYWQAHERIVSGGIGKLVHMYARRNNPRRACERAFGRTTPVFWLGSHDIDMFLWCAGSEAKAVYAQQNTQLLSDEEGPDSVLAVITFANGIIAALQTSWILPDGMPSDLDAAFEAVGTEGCIKLDASLDGLSVYGPAGIEYPRSMYGAAVKESVTGVLCHEVRHFARCVIEDTEPLVSPEEGREVVRVACAMHRSASTGSVIQLTAQQTQPGYS
ncbi:MAG: Gfo/Idh/MocA family oxidoreductase [Candidatus Brocadiae bacterium]|nr:Gfo/Idh/MocA family oxidoreductase [Candidatus Brocadiia bacterium]